jgi:hypothetical protein
MAWHGEDIHVDGINARLNNGYAASKMHSPNNITLEDTIPRAGTPISWQRRAPLKEETYQEWRDATKNDCFLWKVEKISAMLSEVVIKELTAKHEPLFIIQWGLFPARLSLKLWPFENERVLCLNNLVHSLYLVGDRHTTTKSRSPAFQSGISIRWIGQVLTPAFWGNLQHACMNSDVSHYALRGLQVALNLDAEKKITQWVGSHTEKHLESVVFHLVCVEILQVSIFRSIFRSFSGPVCLQWSHPKRDAKSCQKPIKLSYRVQQMRNILHRPPLCADHGLRKSETRLSHTQTSLSGAGCF